MGCVYFYGIVVAGVGIFGYALYTFITEEMKRRKLARWDNTPKDEVILHGYPRGRTIVSPSPYPLKLETYLRLTNIKYTLDTKDTFGPKGKTPWISINGKHMGDTEFIIDFLNKKFEKDLNTNSTNQVDLANAMITRVALEEYMAWAMALERLVYGDNEKLKRVIGDVLPRIFVFMFRRLIKKRAYDQGIGRHSQEEVTHLMTKTLKSISVSLGNKKFFGGDEICREDCGIFGILAQLLWGLPESPYEALMNGECKNLKEYCLRVKEKAWPDWDQLLCA